MVLITFFNILKLEFIFLLFGGGREEKGGGGGGGGGGLVLLLLFKALKWFLIVVKCPFQIS